MGRWAGGQRDGWVAYREGGGQHGGRCKEQVACTYYVEHSSQMGYGGDHGGDHSVLT